MKKLLLILLFPFLVSAQQGPPAWQVPAVDQGDELPGSPAVGTGIIVTGVTAQAIFDNLTIDPDAVFLKADYPNMDTNSTDDLTGIEIVAGVVDTGAVSVAVGGLVSLQFPVNTITSVVAGVEVAGGSVGMSGREVTINWPEGSTGVGELVFLLYSDTGLGPTLSGSDTSITVLTNAAPVYTATNWSGAYNAGTGVITVPGTGAGAYLVSANIKATVNSGALKPLLFDILLNNAVDSYGFATTDYTSDANIKPSLNYTAVMDLEAADTLAPALQVDSAAGTVTPAILSIGIYKVGD